MPGIADDLHRLADLKLSISAIQRFICSGNAVLMSISPPQAGQFRCFLDTYQSTVFVCRWPHRKHLQVIFSRSRFLVMVAARHECVHP